MTMKRVCGLRWTKRAGKPGVMAPISYSGDYVISHRPQEYNLSYRPEGEHHHVGKYKTLAAARKAAAEHCRGL